MPIITQATGEPLTNGNSGTVHIEVSNKTREAAVTGDVIITIDETTYSLSAGVPTTGFTAQGHKARWQNQNVPIGQSLFFTVDWDVLAAPGSQYTVDLKVGDTIVESATATIVGAGGLPSPVGPEDSSAPGTQP